jgi:hypothetical protein
MASLQSSSSLPEKSSSSEPELERMQSTLSDSFALSPIPTQIGAVSIPVSNWEGYMACDHDVSTLDYTTADEICTGCGVVMNRLLGNMDQIMESQGHPFANEPNMFTRGDVNMRANGDVIVRGKEVRRADVLRVREYIMDIASRLYIDNATLVDSALHVFFGLMENNLNSLHHHRHLPRLALAIMEALDRQGTPKTPQTVADVVGIDPSAMLRVQRIPGPHGIRSASNYVETVCDFARIPLGVTRLVKLVVEKLEERYYGRAPETLIGGVILSIVVKMRHDFNEKDLRIMNIDRPFLTAHLGVSSRSIGRMMNSLHNLYEMTPVVEGVPGSYTIS